VMTSRPLFHTAMVRATFAGGTFAWRWTDSPDLGERAADQGSRTELFH
jgi:hypothetical protein